MRKIVSILIVALVSSMSIQSAMAWGSYAHGAIAYVAEKYLTPKAKEECRRYLKHTLPYHASWMDHWRAVPPFHPTNDWHGFTAGADGNIDWSVNEGKAMGQLKKIMKEMGNGNYLNLPDSLVRHHLLILIHSVPDMHCPVHVGGILRLHPELRYNLTYKGKPHRMHAFWDRSPGFTRGGNIVKSSTGWLFEKYAAEVDNITPKQARKIVKKGDLEYWGRDIIKQAYRIFEITPKDKDIAELTAEEKAAVLALSDEMAMKAAYRLAYVLNTIFK